MNFRVLWTAAAVVLIFTPAQADDCNLPLQSFGTIALTEVPGEASEFIPVEIAGTPKLMLLDTGAYGTTITQKTVTELKLSTSSIDTAMIDVKGDRATQFVNAPLKIGALANSQVSFMLGTAYIDSVGDHDSRIAGLLGANILKNYDVSIDFGAHTFALISQAHCDGRVVYWPERPITVIPFTLTDQQIVIPVTLDGHEYKAVLDTGASTSTLFDTRAWSDFGVGPSGKAGRHNEDGHSTDDQNAGGQNTENPNVDGQNGGNSWRMHTFKSLSLAGLEVTNPTVYLIPDAMNQSINTWSTGSMLDRRAAMYELPPMLLGMDVLKHLHIYIAYREKKLYITPAGTPAAATPVAPSPAHN